MQNVHYRSLNIFSLTRWFWQIHTEFHMFRATQDPVHLISTCIRGYHPLWPNFPDGSADFESGLVLPVTCLQHAGLPHSEILALKVICTSARLIAAYHVLHRC